MAFRRRSFSAPVGLDTRLRQLEKSVQFTFDPNGSAAHPIPDKFRKEPAHVSLVKATDAAANALQAVDLKGLRCQVIVLLDGSGSMSRDYQNGQVQQLLVRTLGFTLQVDIDGEIPVIVYGHGVAKPVLININNYQQAGQLVRPDFGYTNMAEAYKVALDMARKSTQMTMIVNLTDGDPYKPGEDNKVKTSNMVMDSSGLPIFNKILTLRPVPYVDELDDLPSRFEIRKDSFGNPVKDAQDFLVIDQNPQGIRLIDNVDSDDVNPSTATNEDFAKKLANELGTWLEMAARVGILTGVPGVSRMF